MIKKSTILFLTSAIILFSGLAKAQQRIFYDDKIYNSNALSMMKLNGKVKSVEQTAFIAKDSLGKAIKGEKKFDVGGSLNIDFLIRIDITGKFIKENYYSKKTSLVVTHKYDTIKNTETVDEYFTEYKSERNSQRTIYKYNTKGKLIQTDFIQFFGDDSPSFNSYDIYKYDSNGKSIERTYFAPKTKPMKTFIKNDDKGNMISFTIYGEEGNLWSRQTFKIDANGNISEHAFCPVDTNTVEHSFTYKYDKNNNVIEKNYFKPGTTSKKYIYTYEYDKMGNWIKRTDFENDKAVLIAERKFEYY